MQPRDIAQQVVKAVAGDAAGGVHIYAAEALHDVCVIGDRKIGHKGLAEALDLDVAAVVRADGHGRVDDIGDGEQADMNAFGVRFLQALQLGQTLIIGLDGGHIGVDLRLNGGSFFHCGFLQLAEEGTVGSAQLVFLCAQVACLGDGRAVFLIQFQNLVHEGQLLILELLFDVLTHEVGVFPDESDIQHGFSPQYFNFARARRASMSTSLSSGL